MVLRLFWNPYLFGNIIVIIHDFVIITQRNVHYNIDECIELWRRGGYLAAAL